MATRTATWAYRDRFHESFARTYFRRFSTSLVSSIGIGTYLGDPTDAVDERYEAAIVEALEHGCNVVDTAINYRNQRSERVVGRTIDTAAVDREAVLVATKGGFVPFDGARPPDPAAYVESTVVDPGLATRDEIVRGNCLAPDFLEWSLARSLENLDLDVIDLYYLHNPETQLERFDRSTIYDRIEEAFVRLEARALEGDIRHYGVSTWEAFRVPDSHERYLSLPEIVRRARRAASRAGASSTHLRAIQLPFNVRMADAFTVEAHVGPDGPTSALWFAADAGLDVFTSASILQGELANEGAIPPAVDRRLSGDTPAQRAINFARSAPGVTCSLVGTGSPEHVPENVAAGTFEPMGATAFDAVFE